MRVSERLPKTISATLDLLFPLACVSCRKEGAFICEPYRPGLPELREPYCRLCAEPGPVACQKCLADPPRYDGIRAPYRMEGPVREMVYGLKYRNYRAYAPHIAALLAEHISILPSPTDGIVPIPLHKARLRERGYNQAELMARELSKLTAMPVAVDLLSRTKNTLPQVSLETDKERRENIRNAFTVTGDVRGLSILLLDDVVTTGATMNAAAGALKKAGAASVWGLALARRP